jgi:hypothetical protein
VVLIEMDRVEGTSKRSVAALCYQQRKMRLLRPPTKAFCELQMQGPTTLLLLLSMTLKGIHNCSNVALMGVPADLFALSRQGMMIEEPPDIEMLLEQRRRLKAVTVGPPKK